MNPVIQENATGCGIACVAMLAGRSYAETRSDAGRLGIFADDRQLWSETGPVRRLLSYYNIAVEDSERPFSTWKELPDLALLAIKWRLVNERPCWHWTVFCRDHGEAWVLDPKAALRTNRRSDFGRIHPRWYLAVVPG